SALPFFALTGLKKFVPQIAELFNSLERYNIFWQLPTDTILYDAYSDFSVYGVAVFSLVLGAASAWISRMTEKRGRVFGILMYVQFANCLLLSFFSTWFSNATIWFYFIATFAIALFCTGEEKGLFRLRPRDLTEEMKC
ncbi:MAG: oligosaccharide repeat unit polymerase, partial [Lachnospiraceae bacterium]|nr:oligosaccharide repeat unit polymerase [Lachnospiraceae bacterium]